MLPQVHAPLPNRPHITLSEWFTWNLDGEARSDAQVKRLVVEQCNRDKSEWGCHFGPGWLKYHLELMVQGCSDYPLMGAGDDESYQIGSRHFRTAQHWLERKKMTALNALAKVEAELERRKDRDPRHQALEDYIFRAAEAGKLTIFARRWDPARNCARPEYEAIPSTFFLRPCRFSYGLFHDASEIVRWPDDGAPHGLLDSVFNTSDPPVSYVHAKIARDLAKRLADSLRRPHSRAARDNAERLCLAWLCELMSKSPDKPTQTKTDLRIAARDLFGVGPDIFDRVWKMAIVETGAQAWSRPGRPKSLR